MRRLGLRGRVVLASVVVLAVGVLVIGVSMNVLLTDRLTSDAKAVLTARADAQRTTVVLRGGRVTVREGTQAEALDREAWVFADGRLVARPSAGPPVQRAARALAGVHARTIRDVPGQEVRLLAAPVRDRSGHQAATVVVALTLKPYEETESIARLGTILLGAFVILAGALIAWRSVGAGLRPVGVMAHRADGYGDHDLAARFDMGPPRDELTALAATLDGLLGRLEASLRREQRLSAEMAHELRTPLSGVRATAELGLLEDQPDSMRRALGDVISSADRMDGVIDALLAAARGGHGSGGTCDVSDAVGLALAAVAEHAAERRVAVRPAPAPSGRRVGADAQIVAHALNPLLENAIRHAVAEVSVTVSVDEGAHRVHVAVDDDGPGIAETDAEAIFEPGWQTPGGSGAGLGLALARRLATSLGGEVRSERASAGARVVLDLPLIAGGAPGP